MTNAIFDALDGFLASDGTYFVVAHKKENRKNTLLANWSESSSINDGKKVIYHCVRRGKDGEDYRKVLDRLCDEIRDLYSLMKPDTERLNTKKSWKQLEELYKEIYSKEPLTIILDGVERVVSDSEAKTLQWLPFPTKKVKYIFGTCSEHGIMELFKRREYPICHIDSSNVDWLSAVGREDIEDDFKSEPEITAYNYYSANNPDKLYETICSCDVFELLYDNDIYQLCKYWELLSKTDKSRFSPLKHIVCADEERRMIILRKLTKFFNDYCPDMEAAMHFAEQSLKYSQEQYGEEHRETLRRQDDIVDIHLNFREYYDAWEYYNKVLDIRRKVLGEEDLDTAVSYDKMGDVEQCINDEDEVTYLSNHTEFEYYERALEIRRKVLGDNHPLTINTFESIGRKYLRLVNYSNLEMDCYDDDDFTAGFTGTGYLKTALEIKRNIYGEQHPYIADLYSRIAGSDYFAGQSFTSPHQRSLDFYEKALKVQEVVYGKYHPDTSQSYSKAAEIHAGYHRFKEAAEYIEKSLMYTNRYDDMKSYWMIRKYDDLGLYYIHTGNYSLALDRAKKALDLKCKIKKDDRELAIPHYNIGVVYDLMDNHSLAMEFFRKAYELDDDLYWTYYTSLISSCKFEGNNSEAAEYQEKADAIKREIMDGKKL